MNKRISFSDETICAFVDNELSVEEREQVFDALEQDVTLAQQLIGLQVVQGQMRDAYAEHTLPPMESLQKEERKRSRWLRSVAVLALFTVGGGIGWLAHGQWQQQDSMFAAVAPTADSTHVLLHIDRGDRAHMQAVMLQAGQMLAAARKAGRPLSLEVLANDTGLNLLNGVDSPYRNQIAALKAEYPNVSFLACARALQHLRERGVDMKLVPQAKVVPSALDEILKRVEGGWAYRRI